MTFRGDGDRSGDRRDQITHQKINIFCRFLIGDNIQNMYFLMEGKRGVQNSLVASTPV